MRRSCGQHRIIAIGGSQTFEFRTRMSWSQVVPAFCAPMQRESATMPSSAIHEGLARGIAPELASVQAV